MKRTNLFVDNTIFAENVRNKYNSALFSHCTSTENGYHIRPCSPDAGRDCLDAVKQ